MNRVRPLLGVGELEYSLRFSSLVTLGAPVLGRRRRGRGWQFAWLARLRRRFVEDVGAVDVSAQFVDVVVVIVFVVVERSARRPHGIGQVIDRVAQGVRPAVFDRVLANAAPVLLLVT